MLLNGLTAVGSFTATSSPLKLRLMVNAPTATVDGTELSGTGYTALGTAITFASASGTSTGAVAANTNSITWTNGGSSAWSIAGLEIWDATPTRKFYGLWSNQPLVIGVGSPFTVAIAALGISIP
jgi:hypothetical protein